VWQVLHVYSLNELNQNALVHSNAQTQKDKTTKAHLKIGVQFLEEELLDFQVKLYELDERIDDRHVEFCAGELLKERKWTSTAVKTSQIFCQYQFCLQMHCHSLLSLL